MITKKAIGIGTVCIVGLMLMTILSQPTYAASLRIMIGWATILIQGIVVLAVGSAAVWIRRAKPAQSKTSWITGMVAVLLMVFLITAISKAENRYIDNQPMLRDAVVELGPQPGSCSGVPPAIVCRSK